MSQYPNQYGGPPPFPPPPQVVKVVSHRGGFGQAVLFVFSLVLFAGIFALGIAIGAGVVLAAGSIEDVVLERSIRNGGFQRVAIIPVKGAIDDSTADFVRVAVDHVVNDASIDAVVLRVDSPGGAVSPSDRIWREMERLKREGRPVVASFGGVAASGGYYVSCAATHIVAEPTTITGSIGVIAQVLTLEGLMEKIGVDPVTMVAAGSPQKDVANDVFRAWTDADRAKVGTMLDAAYEVFTARVRDGRGAHIGDQDALNAVANGSIFTASQAIDNGLIDQVGYLDDAIAVAEQRSGIARGAASVIELSLPPTLFGNGIFATGGASLRHADDLRSTLTELSAPRVMYLMH